MANTVNYFTTVKPHFETRVYKSIPKNCGGDITKPGNNLSQSVYAVLTHDLVTP